MTLTSFVFPWLAAAGVVAPVEHEVGGPLAGVPLPLLPAEHGDPPGYPGCIVGIGAPEGMAPQVELAPGSLENWRAYMFKYLPIRSFFDRQSRARAWTAPAIPGGLPVETYAVPLWWVPRHERPVDTGLRRKPVDVVRLAGGSRPIALDLGELDAGLWAVRLIGAVEPSSIRSFRRPLFLEARIDDGPGGETSFHRLRLGYCDELYSVAEVYFHALERRAYRAELRIGEGSEVDLLLREISLDDVLAGTDRRALKTRTTIARPRPAAPSDSAARLDRDEAIWSAFPPINRQGSLFSMAGGDEHELRRDVAAGAGGKTAPEIEEASGRWTRPADLEDPAGRGVFLVNEKLGLRYSFEDLRLHRPLPAPYPWPDDGAGLCEPDAGDPGRGSVWCPIADEVAARIRDFPMFIHSRAAWWQESGDAEAGRDAAVALLRFAWAFPAIDAANFLASLVRDPGPYGRDYRCRRRETSAAFLPHYANYVDPLALDYDRVFEIIRADAGLAASIGRFVPWVREPADLVRLADVYLVQTIAKRILRYHYHTDPVDIATLAAVVGDTSVTDPWMEWLFSRTFVYPLPPSGIQDCMITGCDRDGCEYIGSTFYAQGEGASRVAAALDRYRAAGGNPRFDLGDPRLYPKPAAHCRWRLLNVVAGGDFLRIGDVTGPDKAPGYSLADLGFARHGWRWTGDPAFAFVLRHYRGREGETDAEWAAIEAAAAGCPRAPWLESPSRVLPMWAGILETGLEHDDPRFRRAAYVRVGFGTGHSHEDSMDLQVVSGGQPATVDGGQRPGYSNPGDRATRVHDVVEVDGRNFEGWSWVRSLADAPGARSIDVDSEPPDGVRVFRRQVCLVDVHEGSGSRPLPIPLQRPGSKLPGDVTPAASYVFDVFRVSGGKLHTYCFHGPVDDDIRWNAIDPGPPDAGGDEERYLAAFEDLPERKLAGTAPAVLEATWRQTRDPATPGSEQRMLGANFSEALPRRFTRLHLLGAEGARALRAGLQCFQWKYAITCLMVRRSTAEESLDSAFAAIIEPFAGEPEIRERRLLAVPGGGDDALRPLAAEVILRGGRRDVLFADGRPGETRSIPAAGIRVEGETAFWSADEGGVRQATIAGGVLLEGPGLTLRVERAERRGRVVEADHLEKAIAIDEPWPPAAVPGSFEIGVPGHRSTVTGTRLEPRAGGCRIVLDGGADAFRSRVTAIDSEARVVRCALGPAMGTRPGIRDGWVASDDERRMFWRAESLGDGAFRLSGPPVAAESFAPSGVLRLWEFGAGDEVRQATFASVRRTGAGAWEVAGNADLEVTFPGREPIRVSAADLARGKGVVSVRP